MLIGAHESVSGGIHNALSHAASDGCESLQVFVKSPNRWEAAALKENDVKTFHEKAYAFGFANIATHAAYLINLASPKDDVREKSIKAMIDELNRCDELKIPYYVLHPGSPLDSGYDSGIKRIVYGLDEVLSSAVTDVTVLLESTAGMGNSIGDRFEHLQEIMDKSKFQDKLGVCLDTCHIFSAGYDIAGSYDKVMDEVVERFGSKMKVFHLNDSKNPLGSRKDRHALIGKGEIGEEPFRRLVNDRRMEHVLGILETPVEDSYAHEIKLLKSFRAF